MVVLSSTMQHQRYPTNSIISYLYYGTVYVGEIIMFDPVDSMYFVDMDDATFWIVEEDIIEGLIASVNELTDI